MNSERFEKILEILDTKKYISNSELASQLFVSLPTIRRDLSEMEHDGLIIRSHGGAKKAEEGQSEVPLAFRNTYKQKEKRLICLKASELVHDGDTIFIDASTTAWYFAETFKKFKSLTIVTNGTPIASIMSDNGFRTFVAGGDVSESSHAVTGCFAEDFVQNFNYDVAFFSSYGVLPDGNITDTTTTEISVRKKAFRNAAEKVFLFDGSKMGLSAPFNLINVRDVDYVVTDASLPEGFPEPRKKTLFAK